MSGAEISADTVERRRVRRREKEVQRQTGPPEWERARDSIGRRGIVCRDGALCATTYGRRIKRRIGPRREARAHSVVRSQGRIHFRPACTVFCVAIAGYTGDEGERYGVPYDPSLLNCKAREVCMCAAET